MENITKLNEAYSKGMMTLEESERVGRITKKVNDMLSVRNVELERWEDNIQRQQFEQSDSQNKAFEKLGRSHLRIPTEFSFVESKTADEIDTLPFPIVVPTEKEDVETAEDFQKLMDYVCDNTLNLKEIMIRMYLKQKNTLGDGILKVFYNTEKRMIRIPIQKKNGKIKYREEEVTVYDDIKVEMTDIRNFVIDPIVYQPGKTLCDANMCGFFNVYDFDTFKELYSRKEGYKNIDLVKPMGRSLNTLNSPFRDQDSSLFFNEELVEVYEHWDILKDELVVVANGIEIRETAIPYYNPFTKQKKLPIAHFIDHMSSTGFWNISTVDLVKDLAEERQTQRNINIDAAKSYTHPWLFVGGMNDFDADEFIAGINPIANVDDVNQIKQLNIAGNTGLPFQLEQANQNDAIVVTGHDVTGVLGAGTETATRTLEKKESQVRRTKFINTYNEVNGHRRLYGLIKDLILQFYDKKKVEEIIGSNELNDMFKNKDSFKFDYDIIILPNNQLPASKEIQKMRNQEMLAVLGQMPFDPATGQLPKYLIEPVKKVLEGMGVTDDIIESVFGEEEQEQGEEGDADLQQALLNAQQSVPGMEGNIPPEMQKMMEGGMNFGRRASAPAATGGGVQENVQSVIQNMIPTKQ